MSQCSKCHQECENCVVGPDGTHECGLCNAVSKAESHYELPALINYLHRLQEPSESPKKLFENLVEKRGPGRPRKS